MRKTTLACRRANTQRPAKSTPRGNPRLSLSLHAPAISAHVRSHGHAPVRRCHQRGCNIKCTGVLCGNITTAVYGSATYITVPGIFEFNAAFLFTHINTSVIYRTNSHSSVAQSLKRPWSTEYIIVREYSHIEKCGKERPRAARHAAHGTAALR